MGKERPRCMLMEDAWEQARVTTQEHAGPSLGGAELETG